MLGHPDTGGGSHKGHRRGDIKGLGPIPAGAAGVNAGLGMVHRLGGPHRLALQHPRHASQLIRRHPLSLQGGQQGP